MPTNTVRIISGKWGGRKLKFPSSGGLRPSADRTRETLFNWLAPHLPDARCLDLFAGSGALGFEAASRGARSVDLVEQQPTVAAQLRASVADLGADSVRVHRRDARSFLRSRPPQTYDLVFVDPPFSGPLARQTLQLLPTLDPCPLASDALIYLEQSIHDALSEDDLGPAYRVRRDKRFGDSSARLLEWSL